MKPVNKRFPVINGTLTDRRKENPEASWNRPRKTELLRDVLREKDKAPVFTLPNRYGEEIRIEELLSHGRVVLKFYGAGWYRYCYLELLAWQHLHQQLGKYNSKLVAIFPEPLDLTSLTFEILIDTGNKVARQFGLVSKVSSPKAKKLQESFCIDLISLNNNQDVELPMPATYIIDSDGTILEVFIEVSWHSHKDPSEILRYLG